MWRVELVDVARRRHHRLLSLRQDHRLKHVDRLRNVRHHHLVGVAVEDIQRRRRHQRVAQRVLLIEETRMHVGLHRMPRTPLIDDQPNLSLGIVRIHRRPLLDHQILHPQTLVDQRIPLIDGVLGGRPGGAAVVVGGKAVDVAKIPVVAPQLAEETYRPLYVVARRAACDDEEVLAKAPHEGRIPPKRSPVVLRAEASAATPVLVANTPEDNVQRLRAAVGRPPLRQGAVTVVVAVLHPFPQLAHRPRTNVPHDVGLRPHQPAEPHELLSTEGVALRDFAPVDIHAPRTIRARPNAVLPMIVVGEAAAGPADHCWLHLPQRRHDVIADPAGVRDRRVFPNPDTVVDTAPQVLCEVPVDVRVDRGDGIARVDRDACHKRLLSP